MIVAGALVAGAVLVLWGGPALLSASVRLRVEPMAALAAWVLLLVSTFTTFVVAAALALLPGHGPAAQVSDVVGHGWAAFGDGEVVWIDTVLGLAVMAALSATAIRVVAVGSRRYREQRDAHERHVDALRMIARVEPGTYPLMWIDHPDPLAYSIAGASCPPVIVASRGLSDQLPAGALAAVLDHERAHLRGRHHLLVGLAEAVATALPVLPLMRRSPALVAVLVELAADRVAARRQGPTAVRAALLALTGAGVPRAGLAMARSAVDLRLSWLEAGRLTGAVQGRIAAAVAAGTAAVLPMAAGGALLVTSGLALCKVFGIG